VENEIDSKLPEIGNSVALNDWRGDEDEGHTL